MKNIGQTSTENEISGSAEATTTPTGTPVDRLVIPRASWTITLEYRGNDGPTPWKDAIFGTGSVTIQKKGAWQADGEQRPVDECLTLDLAAVVRMLHESGELVRSSGAEGVIDAFRDGWS